MIDSKLQAELRERFNPDGSELRTVQLRLLEMLKYIDKICRENNITYWLSSGTCLGAVRHGGFIPWDDDLDIEMLEEDYQKLIKILGDTPRDGYVLHSSKNDPYYFLPFAKLRELNSYIIETIKGNEEYKYHGLFIDIFHLKPSGSKIIHKIAPPIQWRASLINTKSFVGKLRYYCFKTIKSILFPLFDFVDNLNSGTRLRHSIGNFFISARDYGDIFPVKYTEFENIKFPVPNNYDSYLMKIYGNYMQLPDLDKIVSHTIKMQLL